MTRFKNLEFESPGSDDRRSAEAPGPQSVPVEAAGWLERADRERRQGHYEEALRYYSRALEIDKSVVPGWVGQVQMLVLLDELTEAELWSRKAIELFPGNGDLIAARAQALVRRGDQRSGMSACDAALQQTGNSWYRWLVRGELMLAARQSTDTACFEKAEQSDRDWLVPLEAALICLYHDAPAKALQRIRKSVEMSPAEPYVWLVQARAQQELGQDRAARTSLEQVLSLSPGHRDAEDRLENLGSKVGQSWRWVRSWLRR
ncbi:tetratricopeptide repeat protein [Planctellipticum variicoloris]|uniref:tetratricopeptide repeat protein n=1 Tax=Planctellipticum variicoloris TaxID=3064265 RepID=UPI002BB625E3|nr:tetratricopeptide repeat protein [Planctomycetaceae bacterium SH412]HTN02990.1 tetratricopeptide repeat protein [Planctomycetaceae bacterium]